MNKIYTIEDLTEILKVSERAILDALRSGDLKGYKKFRRWFVFQKDLEEFIKTKGKAN